MGQYGSKDLSRLNVELFEVGEGVRLGLCISLFIKMVIAGRVGAVLGVE